MRNIIKSQLRVLSIFTISIGLLVAVFGMFLAPPVFAWSNTGGGDHGGADWTIYSGTIAGVHTNIGTFTVYGPVKVGKKVNGYLGYLDISADVISISVGGSLDAFSAGHLGGIGGRGGIGGNGADIPLPGSNGNGVYGGGGGWYGQFGQADLGVFGDHRGLPPTSGNIGGSGGYRCRGGQCDYSTDESVYMGSGGGGGGGGGGSTGVNCWWYGGSGGGGGAGGSGGGKIKLRAVYSINISGTIKANGGWRGGNGGNGSGNINGGPGPTCGSYLYWGGTAGSNTSWQNSIGGTGGSGTYYGYPGANGGKGSYGAGGGILLKAPTVNISGGRVYSRGGSNSTANGGTLKVFYADGYTPGIYSVGRVYTAVYDASPPTMSLAPAGGTFTGVPVAYTATWSDSGSGLKTCKIRIGMDWSPTPCSGASHNYSNSFTAYGSHKLLLWGMDNNGNHIYSPYYTFTINRSVPTVDDASPPTMSLAPAGGTFTGVPVAYTATWSDSGSGLKTCKIRIGMDWSPTPCSGASHNYSNSFTAYGSHKLLLWGMDNNGNHIYSPYYTFTINRSVPTVDINAKDINATNYSQGPISVSYNTPANISWTSTNATGCTASGPGNWSGAKGKFGTITTGNILSKQTYTMSCTGTGGTASDSVTVNVIYPVPTVDINAKDINATNYSQGPISVSYNTPANISWTSTNATGCTASGPGNWSGAKGKFGTITTGNILSKQTYTMSCTGTGGTASDSVTVNVNSPKQCQDSIDNDSDGWMDYPMDPGCVNATDNNEFNLGNTQCSDGVDNDGDGYIDGLDPSCKSASDDSEYPDFSLSKSSDINIIIIGNKQTGQGQATTTVNPTLNPEEAFASNVALSVDSITPPIPGFTYTFSDSLLTPGEYSRGSLLTITVPRTATSGQYTVSVKGESTGLLKKVADIILNINFINPSFKNF